MALDSTGRFRVFAQVMRDWPTAIGWPAVSKPELQAAVNAIDDWIETNQAGLNGALPAAFRTSATLAQKTYVFCYVAMRRAGRLRAQED
ncbi:MAG: hypothetical protein ACRDUA_17215 [Micromonosporaceae bacterium]